MLTCIILLSIYVLGIYIVRRYFQNFPILEFWKIGIQVCYGKMFIVTILWPIYVPFWFVGYLLRSVVDFVDYIGPSWDRFLKRFFK